MVELKLDLFLQFRCLVLDQNLPERNYMCSMKSLVQYAKFLQSQQVVLISKSDTCQSVPNESMMDALFWKKKHF